MSEFECKIEEKLQIFLMFLLLSFNRTTITLNRGNATLNKEVSPFSDTGDRINYSTPLSILAHRFFPLQIGLTSLFIVIMASITICPYSYIYCMSLYVYRALKSFSISLNTSLSSFSSYKVSRSAL
jgi:hypothetical protein